MRREERRTLKVVFGVVALGAAAPVAYLTALFLLGIAVAPQLPAPPNTPAPALITDALWARADGGPAGELRPIGPMTMVELLSCVATTPGANDNERMAACRRVMPGLPAVEYLSTLLLRDHGVNRNSFRGGAGAMVTTVRVTRSWTKQDFLNTLAARADFGYGWRGIDAAATGYFGRRPGDLDLAQAAFLASRVGDLKTDPWCEPDVATGMRDRVLDNMRRNGAITPADFESASIAALGLAPPPEGRSPCRH